MQISKKEFDNWFEAVYNTVQTLKEIRHDIRFNMLPDYVKRDIGFTYFCIADAICGMEKYANKKTLERVGTEKLS